MSIIDRIKQIIDYKQISTRRFCIEIGVANGFMDKVKDVGSDKVLKILNTYTDISPEWLITGNGKMLRKEEKTVSEDKLSNSELLDRIERLSGENALLRSELEVLKKEKGIQRQYNVAAEPKLKYKPNK